MDSRRFINYRSFRPIIRLIDKFDSYGSQIWALWALANLTTTDAEKYCEFVRVEDGVRILQTLTHDIRSTDYMIELCNAILRNIDAQLAIPDLY